jgi:hypothetical protein
MYVNYAQNYVQVECSMYTQFTLHLWWLDYGWLVYIMSALFVDYLLCGYMLYIICDNNWIVMTIVYIMCVVCPHNVHIVCSMYT